MLADDVVALIRRMAKENHTWGAKRIRRELHKLGIEVAKSTIQRYLSDLRGPLASKQTWAIFLRSHATQIWACDSAQVYGLFFRPFLRVGHRRGRLTTHPTLCRDQEPYRSLERQQLREATPFGQAPRFLIRDVDRKYGSRFTRVAKGTGLEVVRTPYQAPKANAICAARSRNTSATLPCPTTPGHCAVYPLPP